MMRNVFRVIQLYQLQWRWLSSINRMFLLWRQNRRIFDRFSRLSLSLSMFLFLSKSWLCRSSYSFVIFFHRRNNIFSSHSNRLHCTIESTLSVNGDLKQKKICIFFQVIIGHMVAVTIHGTAFNRLLYKNDLYLILCRESESEITLNKNIIFKLCTQ